jgi:hypothetical protein
VCESLGAIGTGFFAIGRVFRRRVGSGLVGVLVTGDDAEHIWWFRPSGTTEVVWWVASGSRNPVLAAADSPARASTSAVPEATDGASDKRPSAALLSRPTRRDADVGDDVSCDDDAPVRRGDANRIGAAHQSGFVMRRTPPRHPPRGPPKIRQCRSQRRAAERFEAPRNGVAAKSTMCTCELRDAQRRLARTVRKLISAVLTHGGVGAR